MITLWYFKVAMENRRAINVKTHYFDWAEFSHYSMAIFHSYVTNYQRVTLCKLENHHVLEHVDRKIIILIIFQFNE